ncbi:beta-fructofuranosidase [Acetoanaerobium pronyense]|uniref:Sucrose-6-phosphate hydrolase n=1 Tax=Acetoanaerobium pronyense TaxID=1482736 RepID=A0ABS4KNS8_9FIRM|nr:sucrose-6-phosphate hydrolase [Acetoanaerobium pronyense]MBP2028965.1 beta-fructofuranosidase [Acetoanaerobium pronyense]
MNVLQKELKISVENALNLSLEKVNSDTWRLKYHVMPPIGWLNDPNGVCEFKGKYHLFYQYSPLNAEGGLKYWGHVVSDDMVNFEDKGIKLYPDSPQDIHGVYSGSAFVNEDKIHFFYTGNVKMTGDYDYINDGREQNTIYAISEDGDQITNKKNVIPSNQYPEGFSTHIRDPKVFSKNNIYYMVLGARDINNKGQIILYQSYDLENWDFKSIFAGPYENLGYMWECPDFFSLDEKEILLISPQGLKPDGYKYNNIYQSGYFIGESDFSVGSFNPETDFLELDCGFDFYAPQTFCDSKGRRIMWAWMGLPDIESEYSNPTIKYGWQHAMTIPRELLIMNNKLIQKPLQEYKKLRKELSEYKIQVYGRTKQEELYGDIYEMILEFQEIKNEIKIHLREDTLILFDNKSKTISLNHGKSGYGRTVRKTKIESLKNIQIFSDSSSLEIFINEGEKVFTTRIYPQENQKRISFDGQANITVRKWDLSK